MRENPSRSDPNAQAGGLVSRQNIQHLRVDLRIGRRQNAPAMMGRVSLPVGDRATGGLNNPDRPLHIIGIQSCLDHQIDLACGQQRIGITIHAIAHQIGLLGHRAETRRVPRLIRFRERW